MIWLAAQGHEVIGVELSPIAVHAFFRENCLEPVRRRVGLFTLWEQGRLRILCGDFFALTTADLGRIDAVYDRAALTALPEDVRRLYVAHLGRLLPSVCKVFLLTTEDAEEGEPAGEALGTAREVTTLYAARFDIDLAYVDGGTEMAPASPDQGRDKVYRLFPRIEGLPEDLDEGPRGG